MLPGGAPVGGVAQADWAPMPQEPCAGAIVHDPAGRLLLIQRGHAPSAGLWSVPGGRCLADEDAADACVREVREETGLEVEVLHHVGRVVRDGVGVEYVIDDYACRLVGGTLTPGDDAADARWVTKAEFGLLPLAPGLADALADWDMLPRS
jgi:8-oxo-dGTP diphosphatase